MHNTIQKAGLVLNLFNNTGLELTAAEVARQLNVPTSTIHDLLHSMVTTGLLEVSSNNRYRLGWELVRLSHLRYFYTQCHTEIHNCLQQLASDTALGSAYSLLNDDTCVVVEFVLGQQSIPLTAINFPTSDPMFWLAGSRVLWAHQPWERVEQVITKHGLGASVLNLARLHLNFQQDLERVRVEGYAELIGGDVRSIAAPVFHRNHIVIGALSIFGPADAGTADLRHFREHLTQASQQLSERLAKMDDPYATFYPTQL